MPLDSLTAEAQRRLARYCRLGDLPPQCNEPGTERRCNVYRDLVVNALRDPLDRAYPIAQSVLGPAWEDLIHRFIREYPCSSPQLWRMPYELYLFAREDEALTREYPWLPDLLLFEWIEIEVHMMADGSRAECTSEGSLEGSRLFLNPDHRFIGLTYPVMRTVGQDLIRLQGSYHLVCYRHPESLDACYLELSEPLRRICECAASGPHTLRDLASSAPGIEPETLQSFIEVGFHESLFLGFWR
jgi:uncharacterized protein